MPLGGLRSAGMKNNGGGGFPAMDSDSLAVAGSNRGAKPDAEVIDSPAGLPLLLLALAVAGSCHWSQRQVPA